MSFSMTADRVRDRSKTVTRRLGWKHAKVGMEVRACEKVMGRKKGEPIIDLAVIRFVNVRREELCEIEDGDAAREGYPHLTDAEFVDMFCDKLGTSELTEVTRIEFEYVDEAAGGRA